MNCFIVFRPGEPRLRNNHPAYRAIISLGVDVVPSLLRDLEGNNTHWFCALREITGAVRILASAARNIPKMVESWPHWAREMTFANLSRGGYPITSPPDKGYSCIAF